MESGENGGVRDYGGDRRARGLPRMGQQLGDAIHRVIGQPGDDIDEVGLGIDTGKSTVLDQGEEIGQARTGLRVANLEPVLRFTHSCA